MKAHELLFQIGYHLTALALFRDLANDDLAKKLALGEEALLLIGWLGREAKTRQLAGGLVELGHEGFDAGIASPQILTRGCEAVLEQSDLLLKAFSFGF